MVMSRQPKTLYLSFLISKNSGLGAIQVYSAVMDEIYSREKLVTQLYLKITMWHSTMRRQLEHCVLRDVHEPAALMKWKVLVPRQSYIFGLDPTNARSVDELGLLVHEEGKKYIRLMHLGNKDHDWMLLNENLDLAKKVLRHASQGRRLEPENLKCCRFCMLMCGVLQELALLSYGDVTVGNGTRHRGANGCKLG
jgi:hypothetical protein